MAVEQDKPLPEGIDRELTRDDIIILYRLTTLCLGQDIPFSLSFDTGRHIPAGLFHHSNPIEEAKHVVQGPQGWRVEVAGSSIRGDDGVEKLYPTIAAAAEDGLQMLYVALLETQGEEAAQKAFGRFFTVHNSES